MKHHKLILLVIFTITLLTAVLPRNETDIAVKTTNHELLSPE